MNQSFAAGCVLIATLFPVIGWCSDFTMSASTGALIDHPVGIPLSGRSIHAWNDVVGRWGESVGEQFLRMEGQRQGFTEIKEIKNASNNGIDRIVIKRGLDGRIQDFRLVEIKAHRSYTPKLGKGQMSRDAIARTFKAMRQSSDPDVRSLAKELMAVQKRVGRNTDQLVEVLHINTRAGRVMRYKYANGTLVAHKSYSLENLFKIIQRSGKKAERDWATRHLAWWDQIHATSRSGWLAKEASQETTKALSTAAKRVPQRALAEASRQASQKTGRLILAKAAKYAGPVAMAIAVALEGKEFADIALAYRRGDISYREAGRRGIVAAGGLVGAYYGFGSGAAAGAWVGAFGGPFAEITVPVGTVVGGMIGAVAGGLGGGAAASYGANAFLGDIDSEIRDKFESSFVNMAFPR